MSILHDPDWVIHQLRTHLLGNGTLIPGQAAALTYGQLASKVLQPLDAPLDDGEGFYDTLGDFVPPSKEADTLREMELPVSIYCPTWVPPIFSPEEGSDLDSTPTASPRKEKEETLRVTNIDADESDIAQVRAAIAQQQLQQKEAKEQPEDPPAPPKPLAISFEKQDTVRSSKGSTLGALIASKNGAQRNPFEEQFAKFTGKMTNKPQLLRLYFPQSADPVVPLICSVRPDATVQETIGYALYEYTEAKRAPPITGADTSINQWQLRIVEEDGVIDDDFPALERVRKINKFAFTSFGVCKIHADRQEASLAAHASTEAHRHEEGKQPVVQKTFLKIHLYSTLEVKQTTTLDVAPSTPMMEVLRIVCKKRKVDPSDYTLKMADTRTDIQMQKTVEEVGLKEFCLLRKDRGPSAGDIFLRPPDELVRPEDEVAELDPALNNEYSAQAYKKWVVTRRAAMMVGRNERVLAIDGDYVHIMAPEDKQRFFDHMKPITFHVSQVMSCVVLKRHGHTVRITLSRNADDALAGKTYDLDAASQADAAEIVGRLTFLIRLQKS